MIALQFFFSLSALTWKMWWERMIEKRVVVLKIE